MTARLPILESWAARAGVAVLVGLSIIVGYQYWESRQDAQLAWITVGAELIAFAGLAVARATWRTGWGWVAVLLTILAAGWCGLTMFEKIRDDSRARVVAQAEQTLPYLTARDDLEAISLTLRAALATPRPDAGPLTITAWDEAQGATVARLERARDDALARVEAAIPPVSMDWIAVARGVGVELIKLLGFAAFGLALSQTQSHPSRGLGPLGRALGLGGLVGATALASPALAGQFAEPHGVSPTLGPDPIVRFPETSKKAQAFALRGRLKPEEIALQIGVARSTVYRWFRDRDLATRAAA